MNLTFISQNIERNTLNFRCNKCGTVFTDYVHALVLGCDYTNTDPNVNNMDYMFNNCSLLKGGNGTTYSSSNVDSSYAVIDTASTPGYFTLVS